MSAGFIHLRAINLHQQGFRLGVAGLGDHLAAGRGHETLSPKFQPVSARRHFVAHAIDSGHVTAIGYGVATLNSLPSGMLCGGFSSFFRGVPAEGGGVEQHFRTGQGGQPGRFREPLIPANEHA